MPLIVNFDGACWPNPGGRATWGYVIRDDHGMLVAEDCGMANSGHASTNNVAEWAALHAALSWLKENGYENSFLDIRGDSNLVIKQLTGQWKCKKAHLMIYLNECHKLLEGLKWTATWIPRDLNEYADRLSTQAWEEAEGKKFPVLS